MKSRGFYVRFSGDHGVLFDCDGVLVNSEELASETDHEYLAQYGLHYSREEYIEMSSGITHEEFIHRLNERHRQVHGTDLPADFDEKLSARYRQLMEQRLRQIPEIAKLLRTLQSARIPFAVATNANLSGTEWKLNKVGLRPFFGAHVYSKDMVKNPKPAPDVYLLAAAKLGKDPRHCFVVEDSVTGVRAGVAAGATVIGYTGGSHRFPGYGQLLRAAGARFTTDSMMVAGTYILNHCRPHEPKAGQKPAGPKP
jgi:HAD superfamily hydrolase (TIGR01509 family)